MISNKRKFSISVPTLAVVLFFCLFVSKAACATDVVVILSGANEVPPVSTSADGGGLIVIGDDGSVTGKVSTMGIAGTAAHICQGAEDKNGPVIVSLVREGNVFKVPAGTKFTEAQMASFKAGDLYINIHSTANPGGELRGQLK
jgi:hypothetical protein